MMNGQTALELLQGTPASRAASARAAEVRGFAYGQAGHTTARWAHARQMFWQEMHVELRRHAGNERFPFGFRGSLRRSAQQAYGRAARLANAASPRFPRRLLVEPFETRLPHELAERARRQAVQAGIDPDGAIVVAELRNRPDVLDDALDFLVSRSITVVCFGSDPAPATRRSGVIHAGESGNNALLELFLAARAQFVIASGWDLQFVSYLVNRPSLTLNGIDPFRLYPLRTDGLYLLRTSIDLATGRDLAVGDLLTEEYFRNLRHHGHREHAAADVTAAVQEMLEGMSGGWGDTEAQARYRARVVAAGGELAPTVRYVATWGPDHGFLGDGRLARVQAARQ
jgi:hypothetical protein